MDFLISVGHLCSQVRIYLFVDLMTFVEVTHDLLVPLQIMLCFFASKEEPQIQDIFSPFCVRTTHLVFDRF